MPILNVDLAALEWRTIVELSGDKIALEEINAGLDFHTDNQKRFNLPSRLIAKVFLFRWIYRGSAYAYSKDPDFAAVSTDPGFWQKIIDQFNEKYSGIFTWQEKAIYEVMRTGKYVSPITGRFYPIEAKEFRGELKWPIPDIVNYPNQGLGADIAALIRTEHYKYLSENDLLDRIKMILTVHDSFVYDCDYGHAWYEAYDSLQGIIQTLPERWEQRYGTRLVVPHKIEAEVGVNYKWLHKIK